MNKFNFWKLITFFGDFPFAVVLIFTLLFTNTDIFYKIILAEVLTIIAMVAIRVFYFKERLVKIKYSNFIEKLFASSFPSMHSTRAFAYLTIFAPRLTSWVFLLLLIFAFLIVLSRYYLKKHFIIDLIAGILIGVLIGLTVFLL